MSKHWLLEVEIWTLKLLQIEILASNLVGRPLIIIFFSNWKCFTGDLGMKILKKANVMLASPTFAAKKGCNLL